MIDAAFSGVRCDRSGGISTERAKNLNESDVEIA
jgi:hypothetical protein